jgi:hypothetical protein
MMFASVKFILSYTESHLAMQIHQEIERQPGPDVVIDCPACHSRQVPATTYDERTREKLYGLLQVNDVERSCVVCSSCGTSLRSRLPVAELEGKAPDELADLIFIEASFYQKSAAVIALVVAIFPFVGTVLAAIALIANYKIPGWPKTVSFIALGISFLPFLALAVGTVLAVTGVID